MKRAFSYCICCVVVLALLSSRMNAQTVYAVSSSNIEELQSKAKAGDTEAQLRLGIAYIDGIGVKASKTKAFKWFAAAASQQNAAAQYKLAQCITYGIGTESNIQKAAIFYRKSAEQGIVEAQYYLGLMYLYGTGVTKDAKVGWQWIRKAADQGLTEAVFKMGARYYNAIIGLTDEGASALVDSAKFWLLQAGGCYHEQALTLLRNINELLYLYEEKLLVLYDSTSTNPNDTTFYPPVLLNGEVEVEDYLYDYVVFPFLPRVSKFANCEVDLQYMVEQDGHVGSVRVVKPGPLPDFAEEAYRAMLCLPIMAPGFKGNYAVSVYDEITIPFYK